MPDASPETQMTTPEVDLEIVAISDPALAVLAEPSPVAEEKPAQVLYVGPRLPRPFPVNTMTVFRGPLPAPLAGAMTGDPDLAALFVPAAEAGRALREVTRQGSALWRAAAAVANKYVARKEG